MDAGGPCFARLHVVRDPVAQVGPVNMALDEILLGSVGDGAILRLYDWAEPTVSFGYFEKSASARGVARGRATVRRWTGGGIVEHGEDLTYSLCVARGNAFAALRSEESYRRVHAAVARALSRCGLTTAAHAAPAAPAVGEFNACFERPVLHDLVAAGRKVAGGAQRRSRAGLLHQGSIRPDFADHAALAAWKSAMHRELPAAFGACCDEREPTSQELAQARALAASKYATEAWTDRF